MGGERFLRDLFDAVGGLKRLVRAGWRERGVPAPESVAAHSYGVAVLTLVLAEQRADAGEEVDLAAALRMALLHDLPEHATGDLTPRRRAALFGDDPDAARTRQREAERRALDRLLRQAPAAVRARWTSDWERYRAGVTLEARIVRDADKLDCLLQAARYRNEAEGAGLDEFRRLVDDVDDPALVAAVHEAWDG